MHLIGALQFQDPFYSLHSHPWPGNHNVTSFKMDDYGNSMISLSIVGSVVFLCIIVVCVVDAVKARNRSRRRTTQAECSDNQVSGTHPICLTANYPSPRERPTKHDSEDDREDTGGDRKRAGGEGDEKVKRGHGKATTRDQSEKNHKEDNNEESSSTIYPNEAEKHKGDILIPPDTNKKEEHPTLSPAVGPALCPFPERELSSENCSFCPMKMVSVNGPEATRSMRVPMGVC